MIAQAQNKSDDQGRLTDETTRKFIGDLLVALADWTRRPDAKAEERRRLTTRPMSGRVAGAADGGRSASKNRRPVDRLTRAPGFSRPVQRVAIAARLCRPDFFSMTSGIEVRDGGLPRRSGARRQGHGGRKVTIAPDGSDAAWAPAKPRPDETLIRALARAYRWRRLIEDGTYRSAVEIAEAEKITRSFVNRLLRLTLLAPDIVEAILEGRQPSAMQLEELTRAMPSGWENQRSRCPFLDRGLC